MPKGIPESRWVSSLSRFTRTGAMLLATTRAGYVLCTHVQVYLHGAADAVEQDVGNL